MAGMTYGRPGGMPSMTLPSARPMPMAHQAIAKSIPKAPTTTVINGRTYTFQPGARFAGSVSPEQGFQMDNGTWTAMEEPGSMSSGAASAYARPAARTRAAAPAPVADDYGLEDFNISRAYSQVQPMLPPTPGPAPSFARPALPGPEEEIASESAAFGRAKDRIGQLGRGSMTALTESLDARGMGGAGYEASARGELLADTQGQLGEVIRDQAIQSATRRRQVNDRNVGAEMDLRSQDMGYATNTRGQDIQAGQARAAASVPLMQLIAANRSRRRLY